MGVKQRGNNWQIDYYAHGRRIRKVVRGSRSLAEIVLKKLEVEVAEGKYLDIKKELKVKFVNFADEYIEIHCKQNNRSWQRSILPNMKVLKRFFTGRYLSEITPLMVENFKRERKGEGVTAGTVNRALALLKTMFNKATLWGKFNGMNPVKGIEFYKEDNMRLRFLEKEEIPRFIQNCSDSLRPIVIVALNTGMRKSEILNLKWHDVDFKRDLIYLYRTKNGEKREIPMNEEVKVALIKVRKHPNSPYVFPNEVGKPFSNLRKSFFTACKKSGIVNFWFHALRHTFASQLVMCGVDLNTVRELLGHKSLEMTLRYSHLSPNHKKRAVDVLSQQMVTNWSQEPKLALIEKPVQDATLLDNHTYDTIALSSNR